MIISEPIFLPIAAQIEQPEEENSTHIKEELDNFNTTDNSEQETFKFLASSLIYHENYHLSEIYSLPFERYPSIDTSISCFPAKLGYTQEEANELFDPSVKFRKCDEELTQFLFLNSDK